MIIMILYDYEREMITLRHSKYECPSHCPSVADDSVAQRSSCSTLQGTTKNVPWSKQHLSARRAHTHAHGTFDPNKRTGNCESPSVTRENFMKQQSRLEDHHRPSLGFNIHRPRIDSNLHSHKAERCLHCRQLRARTVSCDEKTSDILHLNDRSSTWSVISACG